MRIDRYLTDDWEAVYVDGRCIDQGHSVNKWNLVKAICPEAQIVETEFPLEAMADFGFRFPERIDI